MVGAHLDVDASLLAYLAGWGGIFYSKKAWTYEGESGCKLCLPPFLASRILGGIVLSLLCLVFALSSWLILPERSSAQRPLPNVSWILLLHGSAPPVAAGSGCKWSRWSYGKQKHARSQKKKAQYHIMMCLYNISDQDIESNCEPAPHMCLWLTHHNSCLAKKGTACPKPCSRPRQCPRHWNRRRVYHQAQPDIPSGLSQSNMVCLKTWYLMVPPNWCSIIIDPIELHEITWNCNLEGTPNV